MNPLPAVINVPVMIVWSLAMALAFVDALSKGDVRVAGLKVPATWTPWLLLVVGLFSPMVASLMAQAQQAGSSFALSALTVFPAIVAGFGTYFSAAGMSRGVAHVHGLGTPNDTPKSMDQVASKQTT
jgi:hypothetical protein